MTTIPSGQQPAPRKRRTGFWIGCGVVAVIAICGVLFIVFGGITGLIDLFNREPEGLQVETILPATPVTVDEAFTLSISLANEGTKTLTVDQIQLPSDLTAVAQVTGLSHEGVLTAEDAEQSAYAFNIEIAPQGQQTVNFTLRAVAPGEVHNEVKVGVGNKSKLAAIDLEIVQSTVLSNNGSTTQGNVIPYQSVVQIVALVDLDGELVEGWTGSGTVISEDGLILTNAHVVLSDRYYDVVDLVVAITQAQDAPPAQMFYADVLQADAQLDLAVIKVRSDLNGGAPNFGSLGIPAVPLGDSNALQLGDSLVIIGYPGIGGETITLTRGEVSGFTSEEPYGNRAYIKTSATIAGGNSGGLAANPQGEIIGVPTAVGTGDIEDAFVDCRRLADTNRDGVIDEYDNCVPTGGFINALRPIQLALPMIRAAEAGQVAIVESAEGATQEEYNPEGNLILSDGFDSNANDWYVGNTSAGYATLSNSEMVIGLNQTNYLIWTDLPDVYGNVVMGVNAQVLQAAGDGDFGFICGLQDEANFIAMEISEDGYFVIYQYVNDELDFLVDWTYSDLVAAGGPFTLAAYCGTDRLAFAVNDTLLAEVYHPNYTPGWLGLLAGSYENTGLTVGFDDFYLMEP